MEKFGLRLRYANRYIRTTLAPSFRAYHEDFFHRDTFSTPYYRIFSRERFTYSLLPFYVPLDFTRFFTRGKNIRDTIDQATPSIPDFVQF